MPIRWQVNEYAQLRWAIFEHPFSERDIFDVVAYRMSEKSPMDTVVDLTALTRASVESHCIQELARRLPPNPMIVAFIAPELNVFGLARMFEAISELQEGCGPRGVFRNTLDAMLWIEEERRKRDADTDAKPA
jgi:hypothetical protein